MRWVDALKKWNAEHNPGKWCVPKKGTAEYTAVRAIMAGEKKESKPCDSCGKKKRKIKIDTTSPEIDLDKEYRDETLAKASKTAKKEKVKAFLQAVAARKKAKKSAVLEKAKTSVSKERVKSFLEKVAKKRRESKKKTSIEEIQESGYRKVLLTSNVSGGLSAGRYWWNQETNNIIKRDADSNPVGDVIGKFYPRPKPRFESNEEVEREDVRRTTSSENGIPRLYAMSDYYARQAVQDILIQGWDTHEYRVGMAHPTDEILRTIRREMQSNRYEKMPEVYKFLQKVVAYVKKHAVVSKWAGEEEEVIRVDDWNKIFEE